MSRVRVAAASILLAVGCSSADPIVPTVPTAGSVVAEWSPSAPAQWGGGFPDNAVVTTDVPADWPFSEALLVRSTSDGPGGRFGVMTGIPVCTVGESMSFEHFVRINDDPGMPFNRIHSIQDTQTGNGTNWKYIWQVNPSEPQSWTFQLAAGGSVQTVGIFRRGVTYRTLLTVRRLTETTGAFTLEVFDGASVVGRVEATGSADPSGLASTRVGGTNGWDTATPFFDFMLQGPVTVRHEG